ncbi:MAG: hypothetical protein IKC65_04710 [Lentisphaeria bacterium]|nr:hypothetical protein [Lentisphaeria bacterium]
MFKHILLFLLIFPFLCLTAQEPVILDFSKPLPAGKIKFSKRGKTVIRNGALYAPEASSKQPEGLISQKIYPELTPKGAFRLTARFSLQKPRSKQFYLMIWDNKGDFYDKKTGLLKDNSGFTVALARTRDGKRLIPFAWMGFGQKTAVLRGKAFPCTQGKTYTLTFDYNGSGQAEFTVNGKSNALCSVQPGGPLAAAQYRTAIGNRAVGNFYPFDGELYSVKLEQRPAEKLAFHVRGRKVFLRNEKNAALEILIRNVSAQKTGELAPGESKTLQLPVKTRLSVGEYRATVRYAGEQQTFTYRIAPVSHDQMPVILWGYGDHYSHLQNAGFTHGLQSLAVRFLNHKNNQIYLEKPFEELDDMLYTGFRKMDYFNLPHFPSVFKKFPRLSRTGKPIISNRKMNVDANDPAAVAFFSDIARRAAKLYGPHPALAMLDVNSEIRDRTAPSFSRYEKEAYKKFSGKEIPPLVEGKTINFVNLKNFPPDRIVADNDPYLHYYRWFWTVGDGWNNMHSVISDIYHREIKHPFLTYFAPSARQPPVVGAGGRTDLAGQWTYAYPDPLRLTAAIDEVLATADGRPVMHGTQLICYRSQCAPAQIKVTPEPAWVKAHPSARYITIPPDALVEAVWAMLTRPVQGLIFHGDGSFFPPPVKGASIYKMTNPETKPVFEKLMRDVVHPLGATLKKIPDAKSPVAILHSFSSAIFAGRGTYGWGGWPMDLHLALQWGGLSPRVIYEDHLQRGELKEVKILILAHCDILTESVLRKINDFQLRGGIIIADETVPPAILPHIRIRSIERHGKDPLKVKAELTALGKEIREKLKSVYTPEITSDDPDIITYKRGAYLFIINDKRTYGDYFGPWKRMAEKALPVKGEVTISNFKGVVYDPVARRQLPVRYRNGKTVISVDFSGAGGKICLLLPEKLPLPRMNISKEGLITADTGCKETIPVRLEVRDPAGRLTDDTHYAPAEKGKFRYQLALPENAPKGQWQITFRVLPSNAAVSKIHLQK